MHFYFSDDAFSATFGTLLVTSPPSAASSSLSSSLLTEYLHGSSHLSALSKLAFVAALLILVPFCAVGLPHILWRSLWGRTADVFAAATALYSIGLAYAPLSSSMPIGLAAGCFIFVQPMPRRHYPERSDAERAHCFGAIMLGLAALQALLPLEGGWLVVRIHFGALLLAGLCGEGSDGYKDPRMGLRCFAFAVSAISIFVDISQTVLKAPTVSWLAAAYSGLPLLAFYSFACDLSDPPPGHARADVWRPDWRVWMRLPRRHILLCLLALPLVSDCVLSSYPSWHLVAEFTVLSAVVTVLLLLSGMKPGFDQFASVFLVCLASLPACAVCGSRVHALLMYGDASGLLVPTQQ